MSKKELPTAHLDDWRERARGRGWPDRELDLFAEMLKPADAVVEVTSYAMTVRREVRVGVRGTDRDGVVHLNELLTHVTVKWHYHARPVNLTATTAYEPPAAPEPPVAVRELCPCGPEHDAGCEFHRTKPYRYWDRVNAAAAETVRLATERQRAERVELAEPTKPVKAKKTKSKTLPGQLALSK